MTLRAFELPLRSVSVQRSVLLYLHRFVCIVLHNAIVSFCLFIFVCVCRIYFRPLWYLHARLLFLIESPHPHASWFLCK